MELLGRPGAPLCHRHLVLRLQALDIHEGHGLHLDFALQYVVMVYQQPEEDIRCAKISKHCNQVQNGKCF